MLGRPKTRSSGGRSRLSAGAVAGWGFRRVEQVEVLIDGDTTVAVVTGVTRRYPHSVRVPLRTATDLVAAGAPIRVERVGNRSGGA